MVKRIWSDEEISDIMNGYSSGLTFKELQSKHHAHYSTIKKVLANHNIDTSNKRDWKPEELEDIVIKYTTQGYTIPQLREIYNCRTSTIGYLLNSQGVNTSGNARISVNRQADHSYFEVIDTEEKAYFLGMLTADGCVRQQPGEQSTITLELIDLEIIERFKEVINGDSKITKAVRSRDYIKNEKPTYTFVFRSNKMAKDLEQYGIVPNKTYVTKDITYELPNHLERHLLRGMFDGDGSIYKSKGRWFISLTNNHVSFLEDVQKILIKHLPELGTRKIYDGKSSARLTYTGKYAKQVIKLLYSDHNVSIDRKQRLAKQAVEDIV